MMGGGFGGGVDGQSRIVEEEKFFLESFVKEFLTKGSKFYLDREFF